MQMHGLTFGHGGFALHQQPNVRFITFDVNQRTDPEQCGRDAPARQRPVDFGRHGEIECRRPQAQLIATAFDRAIEAVDGR